MLFYFEWIMLALFYIFLCVNKFHKQTKTNYVLASISTLSDLSDLWLSVNGQHLNSMTQWNYIYQALHSLLLLIFFGGIYQQ